MYPETEMENDNAGAFNDTNEGGFGGEYGPQPSPIDTAKEFLQKNGKSLLILLVVGVAGFFLYDYLIGSLVKTTINVEDTEGMEIDSVEALLYEGSNAQPLKTFYGTLTLDLRPGDYRVEVDTSGSEYTNTRDFSFSVSSEDKEDGSTQTMIVEKELDVKLINVNLPNTLIAGQQDAQGTITLQFGSTTNEPVELVFEDAFETMDIVTQPSIIAGGANSTVIVNVLISVPSTIKVANTKTGDTKSGTVRVKYVKEEEKISFTLFKTFTLDVNPKTPQTFAATANKLYTKTFTIKNNAGADLSEGIRAEVIVKSSQENTLGEISSWFTWLPSQPFDALKKGASVPAQMQLFAPASANTDTITGEIKFYTGFWSQVIPFTLNLTEAKVEMKTTIDGAPLTKTYTIAKNASGTYETENALLKIENLGALPIENILLETGGCDEYIKLLDTTFFFDLTLNEKGKTGSSKTTTLQITAPPTALPGATQNCLVQLSYLDPKTGDVAQNEPINVVVETQ